MSPSQEAAAQAEKAKDLLTAALLLRMFAKVLDWIPIVEEQAAAVKTIINQPSLPCVCGKEYILCDLFRCLYCGIWFCEKCAERHFGQSVDEYHGTKRVAFTVAGKV